LITEFIPLPVLLVLCSSLLFASCAQFQNIGLVQTDSRDGTLVNIMTMCVIYWLASPLFLESHYWWTEAALLFGAVGLVRPVLTINLAMAGIKRLGPTLSTGVTATTPVFGVIFAILLLGEILTWPVAIGTGAVVLGILLSSFGRGRFARSWPAWAILLPLGASFFRSIGHPVLKIGFTEVPSAAFATLVSLTVSAILAVISHRVQNRPLPRLDKNQLWFVLTGVINGIALLLLNSALKLGQLLTVAPIAASTPVFSLLLGIFVFKRESFTWLSAGVVLLMVAGVMLVAANAPQ
jgi:drug/metabolite transporter (DMT)-like permease